VEVREVRVRRLKLYLVEILLEYKTKDGYRGFLVKVREEKLNGRRTK
jgi:hypothetical protein